MALLAEQVPNTISHPIKQLLGNVTHTGASSDAAMTAVCDVLARRRAGTSHMQNVQANAHFTHNVPKISCRWWEMVFGTCSASKAT